MQPRNIVIALAAALLASAGHPEAVAQARAIVDEVEPADTTDSGERRAVSREEPGAGHDTPVDTQTGGEAPQS